MKKIFSWLFIISSIMFFVLLFLFKDRLNNFASKAIKAQVGSEVQKTVPVLLDLAYNYSKNNLSYEVTFLEFGAKGCSACKRMEQVMAEIEVRFPNKVKVVFLNIMLPENQDLMKYFGVAAIPTQILLNNEGKEFFRHTGYISAQEIEVQMASFGFAK